jgi:glycosyltransferase involved in cell wall biosynthesis
MGPSSVGEGGGGDAWIGALKRQAEAAGTRVEWRGPEFDPGSLARSYGAIDIFCYPSLAERGETFGVAVAEAMSARCAVVVSKLGCFEDLVTDGETGLVFDHASADADLLLAEKLALLVSDARLRAELAARGQRHAARFDFPEVSESLLNDFMVLTGAAAQGRQS